MDEKIKISSRFERWKEWKRSNTNSKAYKAAVLVGLINSPTMMHTLTKREREAIRAAFDENFMAGLKAQEDIGIAVINQCGRRK